MILASIPDLDKLAELEVAIDNTLDVHGEHILSIYLFISTLVPSHGYLPREIKLSSRKDFLPSVCCTT